MNLNYHGISVTGRRESNEDNFAIFYTKDNNLVAAVVDGMGGHNGGSIASSLTIKYLKTFLKDESFENLNDDQIHKRILYLVREVQKKLVSISKSDKSLQDMGTTLNLNIFFPKILVTLNIGDSRTSQFIKKNVFQITEDQNLATLAKKDKNFSQFKNYTNYLTSSLGPNKSTKVDMYLTNLNKKGYIIATTDGVHNYVKNNEVVSTLTNNELNIEKKCENIIKIAYKNNSNDNMTIILVQYGK